MSNFPLNYSKTQGKLMQTQEIITSIINSISEKASDEIKSLAWQFYAKIPDIDLQELDIKEEAKIITNSYEFLKTRDITSPKINIITSKTRAIIEIINDDMPFLVDSVSAEMVKLGLQIHHIIHPIIRLKRNKKGEVTAIAKENEQLDNYASESFIRVEVAKLPESLSPEAITADLLTMLASVKYTVVDWAAMTGKIAESIVSLKKAPDAFKQEEVNEVCDFLEWIAAKNFVFLGYVEYDFYDSKGNKALRIVQNSELGIFRADDDELKPKGLSGLPPEVLHFALVPQLIEITKSMRKSNIHRSSHMDYIALKRFDSHGNVIGERRFLGLFTSNVYYQSASEIPFIRRKIIRVLNRANFAHSSYDGKTLKAILEFTPRDELFQFSEDALFDYAMGVLSLETKSGIRLFVRRDIFERFVSCVVFIPRERFSGELREEIQKILASAFAGEASEFYIHMTDAPLARLQVIITTTPAHIPAIEISELEAKIAKLTHRWTDSLSAAFSKQVDEEFASDMIRIYGQAFPKIYINNHDATEAVYDIQKINSVIKSGEAALELFKNHNDADNIIHLKWYNPNLQIPLSDILPILENMGFSVIDEQPYLVKPAGTTPVWIRDFTLSADVKYISDIAIVKPLIEEALSRVWQNESENDRLGALTLTAHLEWREVAVIRAYSKYLRQVNFAYSLNEIAKSFNNYPTIAKLISVLFAARFNPAKAGDADAILAKIEEKLANVSSIADDKILRRFVAIIYATTRTNYYQYSGSEATSDQVGAQPARHMSANYKQYISFKFDSAKVPELPLPRPYAEIFVYSPRVEGIHLRGGKVARGGLRWSDRKEDFRTEVLGLVKAQMVKNSVIVPVGSKGGFVLKRATATRDELMAEGVACYKIFLSGLLDLTDNIVAGKIVPPTNVVRHDEDDPYLVVAADKGTATFSDYANAVSKEYGFWLGDAFASGGSVGYDHKKMAITARGAFVSVARHFREIGVDIYNQDFTVVGIGDMAGDVFGNGMLLSKHIRLLAAFNHMHIFIDPNPNAAKSFQERERMFNLPRSSWLDYDKKLISQGGGIFERNAKSIPLSLEMKKLIGINKDYLTPDELIHALLLAEVDLLWNGGIGTYVKAEDETHEQVGDRANNNLRVNGKELRCKVLGEGGNLGFTQKGRIEYAKIGGRINTDAIDNSAGVDCSDHEVNIKIGVGAAVASGKLTLPKRDKLLASMTDEVAHLVLKDNILQTQAITITELQAPALLEQHIRMMRSFEQVGELDRAVEFLPNDKQLVERKSENKGLTRPEIAVLLSYSKMVLYKELLKSTLPDDTYFVADLTAYFPTAMQKDFAYEINNHQLKREIIATIVTNDFVNRAGITLIHSLVEDTGASYADIARCYQVVCDAFGLRKLWQEIEELDGNATVAIQVEMFKKINEFIENIILWLLRNIPSPIDIKSTTEKFVAGINNYLSCYKSIISEPIANACADKLAYFTANKIPQELAEQIALLDILSSAPDIIRVSNDSGKKLAEAGELYFSLSALLKLDWLRAQADSIIAVTHWDRLAIASATSEFFDEQRRLTKIVIKAKSLQEWQETNSTDITRFTNFIDDLASEQITLPKLVIAARKLKEVDKS